jgi:enamine deaminase RidA (YjgF/YER057c/UK114 family)
MKTATLLATLALATATAAKAESITRTPIPQSTFPIAVAVGVPASARTVYLSGVLPAVADPKARPGTPAVFGDTATQTRSVLEQLQARLRQEGMTLADVVQMRVFLVGDPRRRGTMDFDGLMAAYGRHFGTPEQPNKPARTVVQVAALPEPGALVEIDVVAATLPR